jgi:hypothetical protein
MARPRSFRHTIVVRVTPIERALIAFYAEQLGREQTDIVRGMVKQYVRADTNFDAKKFRRFVTETALAEAKDDDDECKQIRAELDAFITSTEKPR